VLMAALHLICDTSSPVSTKALGLSETKVSDEHRHQQLHHDSVVSEGREGSLSEDI
jgi:hypothetical protein